MNSLNIESTTHGSTIIDIQDGEAGALLLKFKGNIDQSNPGEFMDPLLDQVHDRVLANRVPSVIADFTDLQFCNSSGIKALINWVMKQMEMPPDSRYPVKFLYSKKVTWQQTSLKAITFLARGIVTAEPV
jgi:hypothetical protein